MFQNYIFDLRDFHEHPGGNIIIKKVIGKNSIKFIFKLFKIIIKKIRQRNFKILIWSFRIRNYK